MTDSTMLERLARAIYDAHEPMSGDSIATVLVSSEHLFPQRKHTEGNSSSKAYQLAAMDVCRTIARAAIEAMVEPTCEMLAAGAKEVGNVSSSFLESGDAWVGDPKDVWQAMLRSSLKADEPRTGFLSTLTPDQRTEALKGFDGDDTLGNPVSLKEDSEWMHLVMHVGIGLEIVQMTFRSDEAVHDLHYAIGRYLAQLPTPSKEQ